MVLWVVVEEYGKLKIGRVWEVFKVGVFRGDGSLVDVMIEVFGIFVVWGLLWLFFSWVKGIGVDDMWIGFIGICVLYRCDLFNVFIYFDGFLEIGF